MYFKDGSILPTHKYNTGAKVSVTSSNTGSKAFVMSTNTGGNVDNAKVVAGAGSVIEVNKVIL